MIRYDRSAETILVSCECGWRDLCLSQEAAWAVAAEHERAAHPGRRQVRHAAVLRQIRARKTAGM